MNIQRVQTVRFDPDAIHLHWTVAGAVSGGCVRVELGDARSYQLVGQLRELAWIVSEADTVQIVGLYGDALDYVQQHLPAAVEEHLTEQTEIAYAPDDPRYWGSSCPTT